MSLIRAASLFIVLVLLSVSGAASELTVIILEETMDQVVLQCVAKGFSPEPKVEWRDSSGNILHAKEVQITERGGSYDIILNMTVTKTDTYSCVVTQDEIKQQTKADVHISVPEQKCKSGPVDLVFLIDDSGSVLPQDFENMRKFMIDMLATLDIGLNATRVGVVLFSDQVRTEFSLKTHATLDSMVKGINQIKQIGGGTMTGLAIEHVMNSMLTVEEGDRPKVPNVLVIVTDGESEDSVDEVAAEARGKSIKIFAVGVAGANIASLKAMASPPVEDHAFFVDSFDLIHQFGLQFQDKLCVPEQKCKSGPVDLVFLIDDSGSVLPQDFENMRKFMIDMLATLDIGLNATRVGVVLFSDQVRTEFSLKTHATLDSMVKGINQIKQIGGGTMTGLAIEYVMNSVFTVEEGDRPKVPNVLVIVTDGESRDSVDEVAAEARGKGIKIFAVGVAGANIASLKAMASPPVEDHAFFVDSFDLIHQFGLQFQDKLCVPEQKCGPVDLVFLIDDSGSVRPKDFETMRKFMIDMLATLDIGLNATRVGVVQFSSQVRTEFSLKTHATLDSMVKGINQIKQLGGGTMTGLAIKHVMNSVFTVEEGDRPKVPNVLVIVTDGQSEDSVDEVAAEARGKSIKIFAVGVAGANMASLKAMASPPVENHAFLVKSFDLIHQFGLQFQDKLCVPEQKCKSGPVDLVYLIDSSSSVRPQDFENMRKFIINMLTTLDIGLNATRVGVVQFSDQVRTEFSLKTHATLDSMVKGINQIKQIGGGTMTGLAIKHVMNSVFTVEEGDRPKVPNVLVIVTDGQSLNPVDKVAAEARGKSIKIFAVGVAGSDMVSLMAMASPPVENHAFFVDSFDLIPQFGLQFQDKLCVPEQMCKSGPVDLVFLIDGSGSVRPKDFKNMRKFIISMLTTLDIGLNATRVGVVQFSSQARTEFSLKTHATLDSMVKGINQIKQIGGRTMTGLAIKHVMNSVFTVEEGDRPKVPNVLVIVTDGQSQDPVDEVAAEAREKGIKIFAVGVAGANIASLKAMASPPVENHAFLVKSFDLIHQFGLQFQDKLCGAASELTVIILEETMDQAVLQCVAKGFSPEPKVEWRDSSGNFLHATEVQITERGDSYDIILNMTVTKTDNYSCVVTQDTIKQQTKADTYVHISGISGSVKTILRWTLLLLLLSPHLVLALWTRWKKSVNSTTGPDEPAEMIEFDVLYENVSADTAAQAEAAEEQEDMLERRGD